MERFKSRIKDIVRLLALSFVILSFSFECTSAQPVSVHLKKVADKLRGPIGMAVPNDGKGRLYVIEQGGKIRILAGDSVWKTSFLDLTKKIDAGNAAYSEKGLLGLVFHPDYKSNGRFFVYYSAPFKAPGFDHKGVLSEFRCKAGSCFADPLSERVILEVPEPESNHNGGQLAFGLDGYLYLGLGDGGGAGDQHGIAGNAQNLATWLGKILRIDIDGQAPYQVPADNPFVKDKNAKPEIWAYGLRNPWKFSFDESTGALWCGDVGQNTYEEIDKIEKGKNYGWRIQEAMHCFNPASDCKTAGLTPPLAEYNRTIGYCVIGGYLYRGKAIPTLKGKYIFGDWKGALFYLDEEHANYSMQYVLCSEKGTNETGFHINAMGRDSQGEIYVIGQKIIGTVFATGVVYKVIP